jgi:hypothetical protein
MDAVNALQKSLWTPKSLKSEGLNKSSTTVCSTGRTCTLASATGASVSASATASRHRSGVLEGDVARRPGADIMTARVQERETEAAVSRCERQHGRIGSRDETAGAVVLGPSASQTKKSSVWSQLFSVPENGCC